MKQKISPVQKALNLWAIILIVWAFYRAKFQMPSWFDEFIAKPLVFVIPVYYYITKREKQNFLKGIGFFPEKIERDLLIGFGVGIVIFAAALISSHSADRKLVLSSSQILPTFFITLAAAISEEILSRGFILKRLFDDSKNQISASFFASILYFFLHIPILFTNAKLTSNLLLFFMLIEIVFSFIISLIFLNFGLFLAILTHFFYTFALSLLI